MLLRCRDYVVVLNSLERSETKIEELLDLDPRVYILLGFPWSFGLFK